MKQYTKKLAFNEKTSKTIKSKTSRRVFKQYVIHTFIIYIIYNLENGRYSIGYSTNGEERKDSHSSRLEAGTSDIKELQLDYNSMKKRGLDVEEYIKFEVKKSLYICGVYSDRFVENIRREFYDMEQVMIVEAFDKGHNLYNDYSYKAPENLTIKARTEGIPCIIEGERFDSIAKGAKAKNKSVHFVKYRLDRLDQYPDYKYDITQERKKGEKKTARAITYLGKTYKSITACAKETGIHSTYIVKECENINNKDFQFAPKEASETSSEPIRVFVEGKECDSLNEAVKYLRSIGIRTSIRKIKERCDDPENINYKYYARVPHLN